MELPTIGKHCTFPACQQLDFLPLTCSCKLVFCRNHFNQHAIECVYFKQNFIVSNRKGTESFTCSVLECKDVSLLALICKHCNKHYCVIHRHHVSCSEVSPEVVAKAKEKAAVTAQQFRDAISIIDKEADVRLASAMKKPSAQKTASKVQLMRIKGRAQGEKNIPTDDRVYFLVQYKDRTDNVANLAVYLSKRWSIGRAVDSIAALCNVPNKNNELNAVKLRLFGKDNGDIISTKMSEHLSSLLETVKVVNGETLILDHCNDINNTAVNFGMFNSYNT